MLDKLKTYLPYLVGFAIVACLVFYPELQGKKLNTHDNVSVVAATKEYKDYKEKGESIKWTNRVFSGMPLYTLAGDYSGNFIGNALGTFIFSSPQNIKILFIVFVCCFFALIVLGVEQKLSFVLSIALGLNTWLLDSLWAFHPTKILTLAFLVLAVAGYISYMLSKNNGAIIALLLGLTCSVAFGHYQIVYYGVIIFSILTVYFLIVAFREKNIIQFLKSSLIVLAIVVLAGLSNFSALMVVQDYNKDTMRGGKTELVKQEANSTSKTGGLDINYAMSWSYGLEELFNFFIPDASGGASQYKVKTKNSQLAKNINPNEEEATLPVYWGAQPFTGAPNYIGSGIVFLLILTFFIWKNKIKYVLLGLIILSTMMGLGKNFLSFNEILFNNLPLYNKFRTPTMSFSILNFISLLTIGLGLNYFIRNINTLDKQVAIKSLKHASYVMLGLFALAFVAVSGAGYTSMSDAQVFGNNTQALNLMIEDRASMFKSDFIRSLFVICILGGCIYFFIKEKLSSKNLILALGIIIFLDLYSVHKRYFSTSAFEQVDSEENLIPNEPYNQILEQDKSHFRVFNTADPSVFNDNTVGYRYSNVGGYSPAKLYRYQDLIDVHLSKGNINVLNMLNTKYFIVDNQGQKAVQANPSACGNAWFVNEVKFAKNANEEIDSIGVSDLKKIAWVDVRYQTETNYKANLDPQATISLTKYHPENMEYMSSTTSGGFVVFSEIWYRGNEDWNLYVDGKPQRLIRTNYLLRGAYIPAGNHKLEMKFTASKLDMYILVGRIATALVLAIVVWIAYKKYRDNATK